MSNGNVEIFYGMTGFGVLSKALNVREAAAKLPEETMTDLSDNDSIEALEDEPFEEEALV
jgi:hypothetical protein